MNTYEYWMSSWNAPPNAREGFPSVYAVCVRNPANGTGLLRYVLDRDKAEELRIEANAKAFCLGLSVSYEVAEVEDTRNLRIQMGWPT